MKAQADEQCGAELEGFAGTAYEESSIYASSLYPSQDTWDVGDRQVICVAFLQDSTTTESFQDSGL